MTSLTSLGSSRQEDLRAVNLDLNMVDWVIQTVVSCIPVSVTILIGIGIYKVTHSFMRRGSAQKKAHLTISGQLIMIFIVLSILVAIIITLPLEESKRHDLFSLLGLLLASAIALASTTFLGNAMAGMMLNAIRNFRPGDFIRVGNNFGRVSEKGLLHTEIQTEDRDLATLPNLLLVTSPVVVMRSSGTVLSATVSLGYDVNRKKVEKSLLRAAENVGLRDAFVQVRELGDFSITYRVAGILEEIKFFLSAQSRIRAAMLDALHEDDIEIVSPTFMNQRQIDPSIAYIPKKEWGVPERPITDEGSAPESAIFDKADEAEAKSQLEEELEKHNKNLDQLKKSIADAETDEEKAALQRQRDDTGALIENLKLEIQEKSESVENKE